MTRPQISIILMTLAFLILSGISTQAFATPNSKSSIGEAHTVTKRVRTRTQVKRPAPYVRPTQRANVRGASSKSHPIPAAIRCLGMR